MALCLKAWQRSTAASRTPTKIKWQWMKITDNNRYYRSKYSVKWERDWFKLWNYVIKMKHMWESTSRCWRRWKNRWRRVRGRRGKMALSLIKFRCRSWLKWVMDRRWRSRNCWWKRTILWNTRLRRRSRWSAVEGTERQMQTKRLIELKCKEFSWSSWRRRSRCLPSTPAGLMATRRCYKTGQPKGSTRAGDQMPG